MKNCGIFESQLMPRPAVLSLHDSFPSLREPSLKINISPFVSMATVLHFTECELEWVKTEDDIDCSRYCVEKFNLA